MFSRRYALRRHRWRISRFQWVQFLAPCLFPWRRPLVLLYAAGVACVQLLSVLCTRSLFSFETSSPFDEDSASSVTSFSRTVSSFNSFCVPTTMGSSATGSDCENSWAPARLSLFSANVRSSFARDMLVARELSAGTAGWCCLSSGHEGVVKSRGHAVGAID
jgi:hypothetical protein